MAEQSAAAAENITMRLERALTPRQVAVFALGLRQLVTTSYFMSQGRAEDAASYARTADPAYEAEAGFDLREPVYLAEELDMPAGATMDFIIPGSVHPRVAAMMRLIVTGQSASAELEE